MRHIAPSIFLGLALLSAETLAADEERSLMFEGGDNALISALGRFHIQVVDQVKGGCLPQPGALKDSAEVVMRRNGFGISEEQNFFVPEFVINALGYAEGGNRCAVYIEAYVLSARLMAVGHAPEDDDLTLATHRTHVYGSLLTGPKAGMQARLREASEEAANAVFLRVSRARDDFFSKFPEIGTKMTGAR